MLELKSNTVNILGTDYKIEFKNYDDDITLKENEWAGYCSEIEKLIVVGNYKTLPETENETKEYCESAEKETLRHEIIHAFLNESGLSKCSNQYLGAWAKNEEMVDWIAIQLKKIYKVYEELGVL